MKYKATKKMHNGISFSSKLEASVYDLLRLREKSGEIEDIRCQHTVYLTDARIAYIVDFSALISGSNDRIYIEAKGYETAVWRIKRRLWINYGVGHLEIWKGSYTKPFLSETIIPVPRKVDAESMAHGRVTC